MQHELLPGAAPRIAGLELASVCRQAIGVGGDYYDYLQRRDGCLGLVIADVSGKGVPAALLMASLQASVRSRFHDAAVTGGLMASLNDALVRSSSPARYATAFVATYDPQTRRLAYCNAGHLPPILVGQKETIRCHEGGIPIGLFEDAAYDTGTRTLAPGDMLGAVHRRRDRGAGARRRGVRFGEAGRPAASPARSPARRGDPIRARRAAALERPRRSPRRRHPHPGEGAVNRSRAAGSIVRQVAVWTAVSSLAGLAIGLALSVFQGDGVERPILVISVLFGNVVGLTAMAGSVWLFPRLRGRSGLLRFPLLVMTLLSGAVFGSLAVLGAYPLFVFRELRLAVVVIIINGVLALVVGGIVLGYEEMRLRLQDTLREMEEVRLVEARLREQAARAELAALQARINPHFFFNTLNTISSLLDEDVHAAEELLETFADLFRYAFDAADAAPVPLRDEIAFTQGYLRIEHARFGDRLRVAWDVDPASLTVRLPGLILQPLIENSVGHGLAPRARGGRIDVSTAVDGSRLRIDVVDDGVGLSDAGERLIRDGHGLGNIARRLEAFYGGRASLALSPAPGGAGARARLTLPAALVPRGHAETAA